MIRKDEDGLYRVECSNCKAPASARYSGEEKTLSRAEQDDGFAIYGKLILCSSCFINKLERWKSNNLVAETEAKERSKHEGN